MDLHSHVGLLSAPFLSGAFDVNSAHGPILPWLRSIDAFNTHDEALQLAIAGGVVLGLQDTSSPKTSSRLADDAQERLVLAFAEVLDAPVWSSGTGDAWEKEFKPGAEGYNGIRLDL